LLFSLRILHLGKAFSGGDRYKTVFDACGLALLDIMCIPVAAFCCVGFWRLFFMKVSADLSNVHEQLVLCASDAAVDLLLLPAAVLHAIFPWRVVALFRARCADDNVRVAILISFCQGLLDLPFALMSLICCVSAVQTVGIIKDVRAKRA
jgi:hypothetical protein